MRSAMLMAGMGLLWLGCTATPSSQGTTTGGDLGATSSGGVTGSSTSSGTTGGTGGQTTGGCGTCDLGETCVSGACQCDPETCVNNHVCVNGRCVSDPCRDNGVPNEDGACLRNLDCGCPLTCQIAAGATVGQCRRPCDSTADCKLPDTSCQAGHCLQNICGGDSGNGVLNGPCNAAGQNDGSCVPHTRPSDGTVYGVCVQAGCSLGPCLAGVDRTVNYALCAQGYACIGQTNSVGTCVQLCDSSRQAGCGSAQQSCKSFAWVDQALTACEPILSQDAGPSCTFPNPPPATFVGPCASDAYQCPLGSPMAGSWYPGADPLSCGSFPGQTLSDTVLVMNGGGVLNYATTQTTDSISAFTSSPVHMHDLFCSGFKYAFIDISAVWCPHCQDEATQIPQLYYQKWLNAGGMVFSVLVQDVTGNAAATKDDLSNWISTYNTPYPICLDTDQQSPAYFGLTGWPDNTIVDLSTMKVVYTGGGADPEYYQTYCAVLGVTDCPAP